MFSFDDAKISVGSSILEPGIHNVKTESLEAGYSSQTKAPYIDWKVTDGSATCTNRYYLNTAVKPGSTKSAWDITKNAFLQIVANALNLNEEVAKSKLPVAQTPEELATKLAAVVVGKPFRIKINGKEDKKSDGSIILRSEFASGRFCESASIPDAETRLRFNPAKDIKRVPVETTPISTPSTGGDIVW